MPMCECAFICGLPVCPCQSECGLPHAVGPVQSDQKDCRQTTYGGTPGVVDALSGVSGLRRAPRGCKGLPGGFGCLCVAH